MNLATFQQEVALHKKVYNALRERIRGEHAGQYIVLANGQMITASSSFADAQQAVERLTPPPEFFLIFRAEQDPAFELAYDL